MGEEVAGNMTGLANKSDRANRRQLVGFREQVGELGVGGFTAAVAHLERWRA